MWTQCFYRAPLLLFCERSTGRSTTRRFQTTTCFIRCSILAGALSCHQPRSSCFAEQLESKGWWLQTHLKYSKYHSFGSRGISVATNLRFNAPFVLSRGKYCLFQSLLELITGQPSSTCLVIMLLISFHFGFLDNFVSQLCLSSCCGCLWGEF